MTLFKTIETKAKVRNQNIHIFRSNPNGYTYEQYLNYEKAAVQTFGNADTKTIGTLL